MRNRMLVFVAIATVMVSSANMFGMRYDEQRQVVAMTSNLLNNAINSLARNDIPGLRGTLQQALNTIQAFRGKSGTMPSEIAPVPQLIGSAINLIDDFKMNPAKYRPGQLQGTVAMAIKTSQDILNAQEMWLPLP